MKKCTKCHKEKTLEEFSVDNRNASGHRSRCKVCACEEGKLWQKGHPENVKKSGQKWRATHPDAIKGNKYRIDSSKAWKTANPEKVKAYAKKRRDTPKGKLNNNISFRVWLSLRGTKNNQRWEDLVGYTVCQLKYHLEKRFKPGMTWENYGTHWHIDHKIPVAVFNYEHPDDIDFRLCWSLKNLQPLESKKNRIKGAKIEIPFQPSLCINS